MRQVSDSLRNVDVTGMFIGFYADLRLPVFLDVEGVTFLPIFSTVEKYAEVMLFAGACSVEIPTIKQIDDGPDFLASVGGKVRLMLDPWVTPDGNTRFTELFVGLVPEEKQP